MAMGKLGAGGRGFGKEGSTVLGKAGGIPGFINFTGTNLAKWETAKAARAAGTRNATLLAIGDSTTAGLGAGATGGGDQDAVPHSWPNQLAALMSNASAQSMFGCHNQLFAFDARVAGSGGWTKVGSDTSLGGPMWATSSAGRVSFTPASPVDTFIVRYPTIAGGVFGTMNASIDAGSTTLINEGLTTSFATSSPFTTTLATHTFNLDWVSGTVCAAQIIAYNSAAKEISVYNAGWSSSKVSDWLNSTNAWNPFPAMASLAADLNVIDLTINDAVLGTALATYSAGLGFLVDQLTPTGSVILLSGNPVDPSVVSLATQLTYVNAMQVVAIAKNVPFINQYSLFGGTYAALVAGGYAFGDLVHLNTSGYGQIAANVKRAVQTGFVSR